MEQIIENKNRQKEDLLKIFKKIIKIISVHQTQINIQIKFDHNVYINYFLILQMETKRNNPSHKKKQEEYVKRLQKIVYEKEKQLDQITQNIQVEQIRTEYQKKIALLQHKILNFKRESKQKDIMLMRLNKEKEALTQSISDFKHDYNQKNEDYTNQSNQIIDSLSRDPNSSVLRYMKQNQEEFELAKQVMENLGNQIQKLKLELTQLESHNDTLSQENFKFKQVISKLEKTNEKIKDQLQNQKDKSLKYKQQIKKNQQQLSTYEIKYNNIQDNQLKLKDLNLSYNKIVETNQNLKQKNQLMSDELVSIKNLHKKQLKSIELKLKESQQSRQKLQDKLKINKSMSEERQKQLKKYYQQSIKQITQELENIENRNSVNQKLILEKDSVISCLKNADSQYNNRITLLEIRIKSLETSNSILEDKEKQLQQKLLEKQKQIIQSKLKYEQIKAHQDKLNKQISNQLRQYKQIICQKNIQIQNIAQENKNLKKQLDEKSLSQITKINNILNLKKYWQTQSWYVELIQIISSENILNNIDTKLTCEYQLKYMFVQELCRFINQEKNIFNYFSERLILLLKENNILPNTMTYIENLKNFFHQFDKNKDHKRLLDSHYELINKTEINQLSEILNEVAQTKEPKPYIKPIEEENNEQMLIENMEKEVELSSRHEPTHNTEVSEIRMNYKMIKQINQQLFNQIQVKQKLITTFNQKEKKQNIFNDQLKTNFKNLIKQVRAGEKANVIINTICALLQIKK